MEKWSNIKVLDEDVASQIAAGEVIERPSSVVKELVENAIDAEASEIRVRVDGAGKELIEVSDNGSGIHEKELHLAVTRHATSKLKTADDLFTIHTLGFRGEALASIASVSRFEMVSCHYQAQMAGKIIVDAGKTVSLEAVGAPKGTSISIRNLFYNVPARLKFLKAESTEKQHVSGLLTRYALAYPEIRFHLIFDDRIFLQTSGNGNRREILGQLYGADIAKKMLEIKLTENDYQVVGFISPISITRSNRKDLTFFVNGRWVHDVSLNAALQRAYHTMIMVGRYPIAVQFLSVPVGDVDVNVHPAKAEIRFRNPDYIFSLVQRAVRRGLLTYSPIPEIGLKTWQNLPDPENQKEFEWKPASILNESEMVDDLNSDNGTISSDDPVPSTINLHNNTGMISIMPVLRLVGQIGAAYLVAEGPDGLYLIDQHAAHERVLFEKMMSQLSQTIPAQALLSPEIITLPPQQALILEKNLTILQKLGFEVVEFGPNTFQLRSIPAMLTGIDPAAAVRVVVEDFEDDETPLANQIEAKVAARVCKRGAVKAGQILTREEQQALLIGLESCVSPRTCPHGRPTMIHLSVDLLEKQFGRRGSL
jgi:DNA mismatch repair protein MutL